MSRLALSLRLVDVVYSAFLDELAVDEAISLRLVDGVYSTILDELAVDEGGENGTISAECECGSTWQARPYRDGQCLPLIEDGTADLRSMINQG